jgi:hypothetical protein
MAWLLVVLLAFNSIGLFHSDFTRLGPSPTTKIMTLTIDTWDRWFMVAVASFTSTCFNDFFSDSLTPFFLNTIQDHKNTYLPYSKWTCVCIVQTFSMYAIIMGTIHLFVALSQIDFMLMRMFADLLVNYYTTRRFMQFKQVDPHKYAMHLDMMKGYDTVLISHQKEPAEDREDVRTQEDDMHVVSPRLVMQVVNPHHVPEPDDMDGSDSALKELLCK